MIRYLLLIILFSISPFYGKAQFTFVRMDTSIEVMVNNQVLKNPWAGGLNAPQFSTIDLNKDGIKDLFVFDRSTNKVITFLNGGTPNQIDYTHAPEYERSFPALFDWAFTIDFNNDGKEDIFTAANYGGRVFKNISGPGELKFELFIDTLKAQQGNFNPPVFFNTGDIPCFIDADNDGDIDLFNFELSTLQGDAMYFYKNYSVENHGNANFIELKLENTCWGKFREDANTCTVILDACGSTAEKSMSHPPNPEVQKSGALHSGSTILVFDADGDNVLDVLIGDIGCNTLYLLSNTGTNINAHMTSFLQKFPATKPVELNNFPAAFLLDVNNDGKKDLIAAPNTSNASENYKCSWLYLNTGTIAVPVYTFQTDKFLVEEMIDLGEGAYPAFFDYNADGLLDIVCGNFGYYVSGGNYTGSLALFKNIGTKTQPQFNLETSDYSDLSTSGLRGLFPTFGDLDRDGDTDMLLGDSEGKLLFMKNQSGSGATASFSLAQSETNYQNIDAGQFGSPQLVDVNEDSKVDLLIGNKTSSVFYYSDTSLGNDQPAFKKVSSTFGKLKLEGSQAFEGYTSVALVNFNGAAEHSLIATRSDGWIYLFSDIDGHLDEAFTRVDSFNLKMGKRISLSTGDIDDDGKTDLLIGNYRGGFNIMKQGFVVGIENKTIGDNFNIQLYPNPTYGTTKLKVNIPANEFPIQIKLYDITGKMLKEIQSSTAETTINIPEFINGMYLIRVDGKKGINFTRKLIVNQKIN